MKINLIVILILMALAGCAKNPVTGQPEIQLVNQKREIRMGEEHYAFGQQSGGGEFLQDPELTLYVASVGNRLAQQSARPDLPYEFVILNESVPNAWALPGGKITINRGLLIELNTEAELAAVLGHEITHAAARHSAKAMERQIALVTALTVGNVVLAVNQKNDSDRLKTTAAMIGAQVAAAVITTQYSQHAELEADAYGINTMVKAGYDPMAAVRLQETFVRLSEKKSHNWLTGLFATHPPSPTRVKANLKNAQNLPKNLEVGQERYAEKLAYLRSLTPAYKAYDDGVEALKKKNYSNALTLANQAINAHPKEALFYGLKGDALAKSKLDNDAIAAYTKAIELDQSYFYYYLQRGKLYKKMNQYAKAQADLRHSESLLPTKTAQQHLKELG